MSGRAFIEPPRRFDECLLRALWAYAEGIAVSIGRVMTLTRLQCLLLFLGHVPELVHITLNQNKCSPGHLCYHLT